MLATEQVRAEQLVAAQAEIAAIKAALQSAQDQRASMHAQMESSAQELAQGQLAVSMASQPTAPQGVMLELGATTPEPHMALRRGQDSDDASPSDNPPRQVGGMRV
jgi:hypothetical protein